MKQTFIMEQLTKMLKNQQKHRTVPSQTLDRQTLDMTSTRQANT